MKCAAASSEFVRHTAASAPPRHRISPPRPEVFLVARRLSSAMRPLLMIHSHQKHFATATRLRPSAASISPSTNSLAIAGAPFPSASFGPLSAFILKWFKFAAACCFPLLAG